MELKTCTHCVMNTSDKNLKFDENGVCDRCRDYEERILPWWNHGKGHEAELEKLLADIKKSGEGKDYDCILGLSGGLDSSYMLHLAVKDWGLRPFVFHIDCGWNLPVAEDNIRRICDKLGVHLHVEKMDWEELRQMQIAFFKSGLENLDVPQDHAFISLIDRFSKKLGVKYILNGYNVSTEAVADPASWGEDGGMTADATYVKDVLRHNGDVKVKNYTWTSGFKHKFWLPYVKGIKTVTPLNFVAYVKQDVVETLSREYGYIPYGQKHFEDEITKFLEGYWMPKRFGHDIRMAQLSSLVLTGQMTRDEALKELEHPPLSEEEGRKMFSDIAKKLEISEEELQGYMDMPRSTYKYRNNTWAFNLGIWLYTKLGLDHRIRK